MYTLALIEDDVATTPSPPACPIGSGPRWIRVGRGTYSFTSYAHVSAAYRATIERLGLGVSE